MTFIVTDCLSSLLKFKTVSEITARSPVGFVIVALTGSNIWPTVTGKQQSILLDEATSPHKIEI